MIDIIGWSLAAIVVVFIIMIHYEIMLLVSDHVLPWTKRHFRGRRAMMATLLSLLLGHIIEIWIFAFVMIIWVKIPDFGSLTGEFDNDLHAYLYFSAANFVAIGNSNIHPHGAIRSLIVSESLTGLMMIAWSASFTYLKMELLWKTHKNE